MNIGIDASRANTLQKTGVEWYAYHVILELAKLVEEEDYLSLYFKDNPQLEFTQKGSQIKPAELSWPPRFLWTHIRLSYEMCKNKPDTLFIPAHVIPVIHPKKTVMTLHDVAFKRYSHLYSRFEQIYQEWSVQYALKHAWKIIVPTKFTKNEIIHFYSDADHSKIHVIPNGFTKDHFTSRFQKETIQVTLDNFNITAPYFFTLGRVENKKNTINHIKAFEYFKDTYQTNHQYILAGKSGYGFDTIMDYIASSKYKDDIVYLSWVEQCEIPVLYQAADAILFATEYEGFGIPILEAYASQTPLIASCGGAHQEIGRDGAWYVNKDDFKEIGETLHSIISNKEKAQGLIEKGYNHMQEYTWGKCAQSIMNVLKDN